MQGDISEYINEKSCHCPYCNMRFMASDYLNTAIEDIKVRWLANLITHYRHEHISSWNKMWGKNGRSYQSAAKFGDYDEEKAKVNERAKRQLIRKCYPIFIEVGIEVRHFAELQNTTPETIAIANKFLPGKIPVELPPKPVKEKMPDLTDDSEMPHGQHKGLLMKEVPAQYLIWLYDNDRASASVKKYIKANMEVLQIQVRNSKK
jgi:hypothetical protein